MHHYNFFFIYDIKNILDAVNILFQCKNVKLVLIDDLPPLLFKMRT